MKMKKKIITYTFAMLIALYAMPLRAQQPKEVMSLQKALDIANASSKAVAQYRNEYMSSYWTYVAYKAQQLPQLTLKLTPMTYYRYITNRYDSGEDQDVYRQQQMLSTGGGLSITQKLPLTGGTFYINSSLDYMRNFGNSRSTQYSSVPIRIGYNQTLIGYNPFKWDKQIEPLKYEKSRKQLVYNISRVSEEVTSLFFSLALAQKEYEMAKNSKTIADSLFTVGSQRFKIASITQADLLTLKLDALNAGNTLENARTTLNRAMSQLAIYLRMEKTTSIVAEMPHEPILTQIDVSKAIEMAHLYNPKYSELRQRRLESEQNLQYTKRSSAFNAQIDASIGFNQVADNFADAYKKPLHQELVSVSVSIPLIDWGIRKGKVNKAKSDLALTLTEIEQDDLKMKEDIVLAVNDFNIQGKLIKAAHEARDIASVAYQQIQRRFMIGKTDVNSLLLARSRQDDAQRNYITALRNYWTVYYHIQSLTLYNFEHDISLYDQFNF